MSGKATDQLREKFSKRLREAGESSLYATVTEVDEKARTCKVQIGGIVYEDVLLYAVEKADLKGFVFIPEVGSIVLVSRVAGGDRFFISLFSVVDKVVFTRGDLSFTLDADNIDLKKGDKVMIHVDAEKVEVYTGEAVVKITTGGLTLKKGSSGLKKTLNDLLAALQKLTVPTGVGPSGVPVNIADFAKIQQDLSNYLEG